jgi:hypothetical protein
MTDLQDRVVARFRQAAPQGSISWHKAAEADEATGDAYRKLVTLKQEMDRFEEIPRDLDALYSAVNKAMGVEERAKTLKAIHPEVAAMVLKQVQDLDRLARRLSMDVDEGLGID